VDTSERACRSACKCVCVEIKKKIMLKISARKVGGVGPNIADVSVRDKVQVR
jgi:hypothetical protein